MYKSMRDVKLGEFFKRGTITMKGTYCIINGYLPIECAIGFEENKFNILRLEDGTIHQIDEIEKVDVVSNEMTFLPVRNNMLDLFKVDGGTIYLDQNTSECMVKLANLNNFNRFAFSFASSTIQEVLQNTVGLKLKYQSVEGW